MKCDFNPVCHEGAKALSFTKAYKPIITRGSFLPAAGLCPRAFVANLDFSEWTPC